MQATTSVLKGESLRKVVGISEETVPGRSTKTSDGIPTLGGSETVLGSAGLSGVVVTLGDISEGVGRGSIEHGVEEAEGLLARGETVRVDEGDGGTEDRGGGRGTVDLLKSSSGSEAGDTNQVGVAVGSNVREGTVVLVEVLAGRQLGGGVVQVSSDSSVLPRRTRNVVGETTTRGDEGSRVRADDLRGDGRAGERLAGGLVEGDGTRGTLGVQHGGTNRGDVGGSTREDGRQGSSDGVAVGVGITRSSLVTRRGHERDTHRGDLHELAVHTGHISLGVRARANLALARLGPAPGHGHHKRGVGGVHQSSRELIHPALHSPEPGLRIQGQREGILGIQSSLSVGELGREGTNILGNGGRLSHLLVPPSQILLVVRRIILELSNTDRGLVLTTESSGQTIHVTQHGGDDVTGANVVTLSSLGIHGAARSLQVGGLPQLRQTRHKLNHVVELSRVRQLTEVTHQSLARSNMLESVESTAEDALQLLNGSRRNDHIAASAIHVAETLGGQPLLTTKPTTKGQRTNAQPAKHRKQDHEGQQHTKGKRGIGKFKVCQCVR